MVRAWLNTYSLAEPPWMANRSPLVRLGAFLNREVVAPILDSPVLWGLSLAVCGLALMILALWLYRGTRGGIGLAYRAPGRFRNLHHPVLLPVFLGSIAWAVFVLPCWGIVGPVGMNPFLGYSISALSLVFPPVVAVLLWRRLSRKHAEKHQNHAAAAWAAWSEVCRAPTNGKKGDVWIWTLPVLVHRRGSRDAWTLGASPTVIAPKAEACYRHILLEGGTGSGKGFFFFSHLIASSRRPFIYQDFKGETPGYDLLWKRSGLRPITFGASAPGGWPSMRWNPVQECLNDPNPKDAFQTLAAALIPDPENHEASWVPETARPVLAHLLTHGGYKTLGDLSDHLVNEGVIGVLDSANLPQGMKKDLEGGQNVKEYVGVTIAVRLAPFSYGWGRVVTGGHDFSLEDILIRGGYVLSAETIRARRAPLVLFWQLLLRKAMTENRHWGTSFLMDEALAVGKISDADDALNTLRSRGISLVFGVQTESGLEKIYGNGAHSLIDAFTSRVWLLNGLNARDRKKVVEDMGSYTDMRSSGGSGDDTPQPSPLISQDDLKERGRRPEDRWAIFDVMGATSTGRSIIARMIPGPPDLVRLPSPEEVQAMKEETGALTQEEATEAGGATPPEIPELPEVDRPEYTALESPSSYDPDPDVDL